MSSARCARSGWRTANRQGVIIMFIEYAKQDIIWA